MLYLAMLQALEKLKLSESTGCRSGHWFDWVVAMLRKRLSQAKVFLALAVLSVEVGGCIGKAEDKDTTFCDWGRPIPGYEIVNNSKYSAMHDFLHGPFAVLKVFYLYHDPNTP